ALLIAEGPHWNRQLGETLAAKAKALAQLFRKSLPQDLALGCNSLQFSRQVLKMQRPALRPALAPLPAPAGLFRDDRFDESCRLLLTPAINHCQRKNVSMRFDVPNLINAVKRRIAGHRRDVDRWILYPYVRVGEIEREPSEHLPASSDGGPDPVVVGYERYAHPVIDRGNFVSCTSTNCQPVAPLILAPKREEPAVPILNRYRDGPAANGSGRSWNWM